MTHRSSAVKKVETWESVVTVSQNENISGFDCATSRWLNLEYASCETMALQFHEYLLICHLISIRKYV